MSTAEELRAAVDILRNATFRGAMTATPAVAALIRAREPIAALLEQAAVGLELLAAQDPGLYEAHGASLMTGQLAIARALRGSQSDGSSR
ncbi:hypothetical protein [Streptomyces sp. NPDC093093]|uniref:hypothetical protein n=1 Tax=Streptomyces sp. NPDC093093 TaxID=3366025 RepID=UPI0038042816